MAKRRKRKPSNKPELVHQDGALAATFVNTANAKRKPIESYADLLAWGRQNGALAATDAQRLERAAAERADDAEAVCERARQLRDRLERILLALVAGEAPAAPDLDAVATDLGAALADRRLLSAEYGYRWAWGDRGGDDLDRMLWPVLQSASFVLTSKYHRLVRRCAGEDCRLFFVDRSSGRPRKWCSARECGSRATSRKHYRTKVKPGRDRRRANRA